MRQPTFTTALLVLSLTSLASPAVAQLRDSLEAGTRVRVWLTSQPTALEGAAEEQRLRGMLTSYSSDSLTVSFHPAAAPVTLAWTGVSRLERSRGITSRLLSAVWRGLQTAAFGAFEFALLREIDGSFNSTREAMLAGAVAGAGVGVVWGAISPQERWSRVRLRRP